MATKYQLITGMYETTLKQVTNSTTAWTAFLRSACRNYKCRFDEQILIYAQRPDATAVLEIEKWNKQFGRWVNKGATGIAVFDDEHNGNYRLKHYFDISDTHESRFSRSVPLWQIEQRYETDVIESLENSFGELEDKSDLTEAIISAAKNAVDDNLTDYFSELMNCREDSFLEELDEFNVEVIYSNALQTSVAYMLLTRCGIDANEYFTSEDFRELYNFNTRDTINALGIATSDIAEMGLREIAATVLSLQKAERGVNRTFAAPEQSGDNTIKDSERSVDDGSVDISDGGRLPSTQSVAAGGTASNRQTGLWQVRITPKEAPETAQQNIVREPADIGQAERTPDGDRAGGERADGAVDSADGSGAGRDGADESPRSDEMGGLDEQHPVLSGGNDTQRPDIQLKPLPTAAQQLNLLGEAEEREPSAFSIAQEDIDIELCSGSGVADGKFRIYLQFEKNKSNNENAAFLKKEYGIGGHSPAYGRGVSQSHDGKGLHLEKSRDKASKITLSWNAVAKRISELITADRYLSAREKEQLPAYRQWDEERRARMAEEDAVREVLRREPPVAQQEQPADESTQYIYHLGVTVFIGSAEYEVLAFDDDTVRLFDTAFPLINKEMPREEFDRKLRENPLNSHLKEPASQQDLPAEKEITPSSNELSPTAEPEQPYTPKVGDRYEIQGRQFVVDSVDVDWDEVSLRDVTFENGVGFPIFRSEKLDFIRMYNPIEVMDNGELKIENEGVVQDDSNNYPLSTVNSQLDITPAWEQAKRRNKSQTFDPHPEIPMSERNNYHITDDNLGTGGQKTKFRYNVDAIKTLQAVEAENRFATPEEQEILARYVGWGGISQAFDPNNTSWTNEYAELHALLSHGGDGRPDEWKSARDTTVNAHYTSPTVIKAIYKAVENMGFKTGNILEPSCGIGNFFGLVPKSMSESKLFGVELDSLTGRIARQLYQKNSIAIQGFETTELPDSFFDLAIGNVPFGEYKVLDKQYDKHNFLIHDYFFARTLDKVRPGGIVAFVTSKGTLDKQNPTVRKYIAQRADLLGAIRLPNTAFKANAGTEVTTDIIFLQKRDRIVDIEPDWVHLGQTESGVPVNSYFVEHPDMILGEMAFDESMYGNKSETSCHPFPDADLSEQLDEAITNVHAEITEYERGEDEPEEDNSIPADPTVRNFSYTLVDGQIYYRQDSRMVPVELPVTTGNRVRGMIELRECVRALITYQTEDYPESDIRAEQAKLNRLYDAFTKKYGLINSRGNSIAFAQDSAYCLLCSLEVIDENGELERKADMFQKRTIKPHIEITHVDTASEALAVSMAEKARVDLSFMAQLTGMDEDALKEELAGVIFLNIGSAESQDKAYVTADEYLSGNVREKLVQARAAAYVDPSLDVNVKALEAALPPDLTAAEISVRLGATWLPEDVVQQFMYELLQTPGYARDRVRVHYSHHTGEWNVTEKNYDRSNIHSFNTYGSTRINAYAIIEQSLNLRDVRIFDKVYDENGDEKRVLNKKETAIAQAKQELIRTKFDEWIWKDPQRRERLCRIYNDRFNSIRPREYDGSHMTFPGMNPEISLRKHQTDAIAHILYGGNTLLAHEVGAGKTYEMVAAAMESKRLGLCNKSLIVVPNHITEQWAAEFLQLYPSANILVATKKDFETKNRKKFCARIATGDYDSIIIGHSQFEKIPMSLERQEKMLQMQIDEIIDSIDEVKRNKGEKFTIKQMVRLQKSLEVKLAKINDQSRKDDVVTFEELGIDRLFIDEAHYFKNLFLMTKMRNVGGIPQTEAQKSSDLYMKCRYLDELTGGRGTVFATGTPISNSMVELYTMQRYLQYEELVRHGLQNFDAWASTFGETVTAIELAPEGTGYRAKTRFAKFYNLPELMSMFKQVADIQTADMLDLPVPKAIFHNVVIKPSQWQQDMVAELAERADKIRSGNIDPRIDNMLRVTNDGRKLALDQRIINPLLPDDPEGKVAACADNVFKIWEESRDKLSAQLVFSDLSTPKPVDKDTGEREFNVYDDMREKLTAKGIPAEEIAFIHDADTEAKKKELFARVRKGQIRVLMGSTQKMGAGTNVRATRS